MYTFSARIITGPIIHVLQKFSRRNENVLTGVYLLSHVYIVSGFDKKLSTHLQKKPINPKWMIINLRYICTMHICSDEIDFVEHMESDIRVSFPWIICCKNC